MLLLPPVFMYLICRSRKGFCFYYEGSRKILALQSEKQGEVSEWSKEQAWKVCIPARVSWVRIPPSPQDSYQTRLKEFKITDFKLFLF